MPCVPEGTLPNLKPFSGGGDEQFSLWLRTFDDVMRMCTTPLTLTQKANHLVGHQEGLAREKIEELSDEQCMDFNFIVSHLRNFFESPPQRFIARQALATCQQGHAESSVAFANRLLNLVRAATVGQDPAIQADPRGVRGSRYPLFR